MHFRQSGGVIECFHFLFVTVLSLQELCCRTIVRRTSVYAIDTLPLPPSVKKHLKSYALTSSQCINTLTNTKKSRCKTPTQSSTRNSCSISWSVFRFFFDCCSLFRFGLNIQKLYNAKPKKGRRKGRNFFFVVWICSHFNLIEWFNQEVGQYNFYRF